jgi:hypothetical protein
MDDTYQLLLSKGYDFMSKFEIFRKGYPNDDMNFYIGTCPYRSLCVWCKWGKRTKFIERDIMSTESLWCHYCVNYELKFPKSTNIGPDLRGNFLVDIKKLNKYILTTSSTSLPHNYEFQEMYITFYTTRKIADFLYNNFVINDGYTCIIYDNKSKELLCNSDLEKKEVLKDYYGDYGTDLNTFIDNELCCMTIKDNEIDRRTLYYMLLQFF